MPNAILSSCGKYRYWLHRSWDGSLPSAKIIMFNPSIADSTTDDPTIKSLIRIMKYNGYGGFEVYNMWGIISPDPDKVQALGAVEARGDNAMYLAAIKNTDTVILAWGTMGFYGNSDTERFFNSKAALCLGVNKNGSPKHPLYLKSETSIVNYREVLTYGVENK